MAEGCIEDQTALTEAFARFDLMESRISSLEESVGKAVRTLMPKVDSLLSGRSLVPSESGSSTSVSATLPTSILHMAEQGDGEALLQFLADQQVHMGSSLERTKKGDTALHVAASGGHVKAVMVLLGAGAKSDTMAERTHIEEKANLTVAFARLDEMESRMTRLEESVGRAVGTLMPKVDALLSGRTADSSESESCTSITSTVPTSIINLAEHGDAEALLELLTVEQVDFQSSTQLTENGDTALHVAASGGHVKAVVVLLGSGAKVNASGYRLRTPLHCAAAHGHLAVAQRLLLAGAQVDAKDADGHTPLGLAAGQGNKNLVVLLLQKGAKPNEKDVSVAGGNGYWDSVELFLQNEELFVDLCNKEGDPLIVLAAKANRWDMVQLLLEKGASATKCKVDEECALVWASQAGRADVVRELLRRGATKNAEQMKWALTKAKSAAVVWTFVDVVPHEVRGRNTKKPKNQEFMLKKIVITQKPYFIFLKQLFSTH
ncbi:Ankyrin repeat and death domain-containing protein 1A, partial [Gryllus bimaculatus]